MIKFPAEKGTNENREKNWNRKETEASDNFLQKDAQARRLSGWGVHIGLFKQSGDISEFFPLTMLS